MVVGEFLVEMLLLLASLLLLDELDQFVTVVGLKTLLTRQLLLLSQPRLLHLLVVEGFPVGIVLLG